MGKVNDGGPAFPHPSLWGAAGEGKFKIKEILYGMSLRDYFAAAALQGMLADSGLTAEEGEDFDDFADTIALSAYGYADAMLAERAKGASDGPG